MCHHIGDATSRSASRSIVLISESNAGAASPCSRMRARPRIIRATNNHLPRAKTEDQFIKLREARDRARRRCEQAGHRFQNATLHPYPVLVRGYGWALSLRRPAFSSHMVESKSNWTFNDISAHSEKCVEFTPKAPEASCGVAGVRRRPSHPMVHANIWD